MTVSENIRNLQREGVATADIARRLGIRYQHVYNVLKRDGLVSAVRVGQPAAEKRILSVKPSLKVGHLLKGGFEPLGRWVLSSMGELEIDCPVPTDVAVYAFAIRDVVHYVGVATMGLKKRLNCYRKPGITQRTSRRINAILKEQLSSLLAVDIFLAKPPDSDWNGLPIHGSAGLELGLIRKYALPWNKRSAG